MKFLAITIKNNLMIKNSISILIFFLVFIFSNKINGQTEELDYKKAIDSGNFYVNSNVEKAERFFNLALEKTTSPNDTIVRVRAFVYSRLGFLYRIKADYPRSIDYHLKSLEINSSLNDSISIGANYHNIGMVMRFQEDYESAKLYFEKAIEIREAVKEYQGLGISYNMLGVIYRREQDYFTAENYYRKAFDIFKLNNDFENLMTTMGNLATLYDFKKEYRKSIALNLQSIAYYKSEGNQSVLTSIYSNIALSYEELKMHKTAITYLDSAIAIDKQQGYLERLSSNYLNRSNNYYQLNKFKPAIDDYRSHKVYADSIFNINKTKEVTTKLLEVEFEKQKALDSLRFAETQKYLEYINETEKNKKNLYFILMIGLAFMGVVTLNNFRTKKNLSKAKLEKERLESELLKQKLDATEREAQRVIQGKSISLTHKKNLLSQIKHLIKKHDSKSIYKDLNMLTFELDQQAKSETLDYLLDESMEKLHMEFEKKLIDKFPDLTKTEREICSLIRSNMSIKDISNIKGVTSASVQSARYRIRKKMGLKKGEELHQFIQNLF